MKIIIINRPFIRVISRIQFEKLAFKFGILELRFHHSKQFKKVNFCKIYEKFEYN